MNPQKKPISFAGRRKALVGSAEHQMASTGWESFGYNKFWKTARWMNWAYPLFFVIIILVIFLFGFGLKGTFSGIQWWMPLAVIGLMVWTVFEFRIYRKTLAYRVELLEKSIRVNGTEALWTDIIKVEKRKLFGNSYEILLHTNNNTSLTIPAQMDGVAYINGFVDSHTKGLEGK
jgi:hypothetical protein